LAFATEFWGVGKGMKEEARDERDEGRNGGRKEGRREASHYLREKHVSSTQVLFTSG